MEARETFASDMRREHRTIQQLCAPEIFKVLQQWADDYASGNHDLRNEATCKLAFEVCDAFSKRAGRENDQISLELFANLKFPYI